MYITNKVTDRYDMYYLPGAEMFVLVLTSEENEGEGTGIGGSRTLAAMSVR